MAAIWRGTVSFGLVSIPVKLHSATEEKGVSFRQVHEVDGGRIRYKRVCSIDGEEVPYSDIAKGYELPDGDVVILTDEDLAALPLPSRHTIEVLQFVPAEQIDGIYLSKGYYLAADGPGLKPYVLLRQALDRAGKVAVVKVALRNRESLAVLRNREGALLVQTMLWPDEVRDPAAYAPGDDIQLRDAEVAMAESYIETLSEDFDPSAYTDNYRAALEELVRAKAGGRQIVEPEEAPDTGGTVVDLMAALRASVDAARSRRGEAPAEAAAPDRETAPAPAAKATAKRATRTAARAPAKSTAKTSAKAPAKSGTETARKTAAKAPAKGTTKAAGKKAAGRKSA
jgi:DNA end-binding protein Ku